MAHKRPFIVLIVLLGGITFTSFNNAPEKVLADGPIHWTDFETAIELNKDDKKPFFIDLATSWCGWCHKMDATTFKDPKVIKFINKNFHPVKLDPEAEEAIAYKGKLYEKKVYRQYGGKAYNELAVSLMGGNISFPTFVVLSKREVKMGSIPGYQVSGVLIAKLKALAKIK